MNKIQWKSSTIKHISKCFPPLLTHHITSMTFNRKQHKVLFFFNANSTLLLGTPPFISAFIKPERRKGGIFHKSLPPRWRLRNADKMEQACRSAVSRHWQWANVPGVCTTCPAPLKISLWGPLLSCDCKVWPPPCGSRCRLCRLLITVRTLRSFRTRAESSVVGRHYLFLFF